MPSDRRGNPLPALVDDIERPLGHGAVALAGAGAKRRKRLEQARLFKEDESSAATAMEGAAAGSGPSTGPGDDEIIE